ncbi:hypothetical protein WJX84_002745 [Apatococcus fuscideae]|uniref:Uncharacterized protein n=1 Tax=Apatococcus fuscideae TaxID=2026836 RepID=A0AAW1TKV8_9CHLO
MATGGPPGNAPGSLFEQDLQPGPNEPPPALLLPGENPWDDDVDVDEDLEEEEEEEEEEDVDDENSFGMDPEAWQEMDWADLEEASGSEDDSLYDEEEWEEDGMASPAAGSVDSSDPDEGPSVPKQPGELSNFLRLHSQHSYPCCTDVSHHQTADALAISPAPFPSYPGAQQLVTAKKAGLHVYELSSAAPHGNDTFRQGSKSLPPSDDAEGMPDSTGMAEPGRPAAAACAGGNAELASNTLRLTSEHQKLSFEPYTVACSPDGRFIAAGGSLSLMAIFRVSPESADVGEVQKLQCIALLQPALDPGRPSTVAADGTLRVSDLDHSFINSLRFGCVAGKQRLLAATQEGSIHIFDIPDANKPVLTASDFTSTALGSSHVGAKHEAHPTQVFEATVGWSQPVDWTGPGRHVERGTELHTLAWGQARDEWYPINCAAPSPDGSMVAAVGDRPEVTLLEASQGWALQIPTSSVPHPNHIPFPPLTHAKLAKDKGSQYCVWHPDSVRLAVSSDTLRAVVVFNALTRQALVRLEHLRRPCLALAFPSSPCLAAAPILVFAEEARNVYIADLTKRQSQWAIQKVELPQGKRRGHGDGPFGIRRKSLRRVNGIVVTPQGQLIIAMPDKVEIRQLLLEWSPSAHASGFPASFRAAVKTTLLVASQAGRRNASDGARTGMWSLPEGVLQHIIGLAAFPLGSWMHHKPGRPWCTSLPNEYQLNGPVTSNQEQA